MGETEQDTRESVPSVLKVVHVIGYILLVVSVVNLALKGGFEFVWVTTSAIFILGTLIYLPIGRLYLRKWERPKIRRYFRPYIIGTAMALGILIGYLLLFYWTGA